MSFVRIDSVKKVVSVFILSGIMPGEVKAILTEKYPDDRATDFLVGDVRGAISVKIALP